MFSKKYNTCSKGYVTFRSCPDVLILRVIDQIFTRDRMSFIYKCFSEDLCFLFLFEPDIVPIRPHYPDLTQVGKMEEVIQKK